MLLIFPSPVIGRYLTNKKSIHHKKFTISNLTIFLHIGCLIALHVFTEDPCWLLGFPEFSWPTTANVHGTMYIATIYIYTLCILRSQFQMMFQNYLLFGTFNQDTLEILKNCQLLFIATLRCLDDFLQNDGPCHNLTISCHT